MLKLINVLDMKYENVFNYYKDFVDYGYNDINNYAIEMAGDGPERYYDYLLNFKDELYFLIDTDNINYIIGYGCINYLKNNDYGNISIGIRPNERNKGYGSKILEKLLIICKNNNLKEIYISCWKDNLASKNIIINNGGILDKQFYNVNNDCGLKYKIILDNNLKNQNKFNK